MNKIKPYFVSFANSTPDERGPGWFWVDYIDMPHGPCASMQEAQEQADEYQKRCAYARAILKSEGSL